MLWYCASMRSSTFAPGEWYHCYNRGTDKRIIYTKPADYYRFQGILYLSNSTNPFSLNDLVKHDGLWTFSTLMNADRGESLVDVGAYALMPNHYHLLLREVQEGGITSYMRKLGTAYTMHFNIKYQRTGVLFAGKFKATHVSNDRYMRRIVNYIHGNPAELFEHGFKKGTVKNFNKLKLFMNEYRYSSFVDYQAGTIRPESAIINAHVLKEATDVDLSLNRVIHDTQSFVEHPEVRPQDV